MGEKAWMTTEWGSKAGVERRVSWKGRKTTKTLIGSIDSAAVAEPGDVDFDFEGMGSGERDG